MLTDKLYRLMHTENIHMMANDVCREHTFPRHNIAVADTRPQEYNIWSLVEYMEHARTELTNETLRYPT